MNYSFQLASQLTFGISGLGLLALVFRKIPVLLKIPEAESPKTGKGVIFKFAERVKSQIPFKSFSYEIFLQKFIARLRILTLKTDNKTLSWLQALRQRTKKKFEEESDYWEKLKKIKDKK